MKENTEFYLNVRLITTDDSCSLSLLCGDHLANEATKPSGGFHHLMISHPALKNNPLKFFKRKKI